MVDPTLYILLKSKKCIYIGGRTLGDIGSTLFWDQSPSIVAGNY